MPGNYADEFHTELVDIAREMPHYRESFRGKTVLCNCDDPYESNFFQYFASQFNVLGLRKLISLSHAGSPFAGKQLHLQQHVPGMAGRYPEQFGFRETPAYRMTITEAHDDMRDLRALFNLNGNEIAPLQGDGDYRSDECLALLDEADIIVTHPPFGLFNDFLSFLVSCNKKFIVYARLAAIKHQEVFPLIKENQIWLGATHKADNSVLRVPDDFPIYPYGDILDEQGNRFGPVNNARWITNLEHDVRHTILPLEYVYSSRDYLRYDNYAAIEVPRVKQIPYDYDGIMGVPLTFLDRYNPDQFEICGLAKEASYPAV